MGGCRFLNVILGASAWPRAFQVWGQSWPSNQVWIATGLGIYIIGVTWFARREATTSQRSQLWGALAVSNAGLLLLLAWVWQATAHQPNPHFALLSFGFLIFVINRSSLAAVRDPSPERVQYSIRVMLLSIITIDAFLVLFHREDIVPAIITIALILPAMYLGRWIFVT